MTTKVALKSRLWKVVSTLLIIFLFLSLYIFILLESRSLPSENWSKGLLIDTYDTDYTLDTINQKDTVALTLNDDTLLYIYAIDKTLIINSYTKLGEKISTHNLKIDSDVSSMRGYFDNNYIKLTTYSKYSNQVSFITLNKSDLSLIRSSSYEIPDYKVKLSDSHVTAFNRDTIRVLQEFDELVVSEDVSGFIEYADSIISDGKIYIGSLYNDRGTHKIGKFYTDTKSKIDDYIYKLSPLNSIQPFNIELNKSTDNIELLVSMVNLKTNANYLEHFYIDYNGDIKSHTIYDYPSYDATPYIFNNNNSNLYIFNHKTKSLGRTEIDNGSKYYPNLFISSTIQGVDRRQLTKSKLTNHKPSYITLGDYDYLFYTEYSDNMAKVYLSSNNPTVIKKSQHFSVSECMDAFLITIINYPALMFTAFSTAMFILLPVIFIAGMLMLLKINWFDRTKNISISLLIIYNISKLTLYATSIFKEHLYSQGLPTYLKSPINHWGMFLIISLITGYVAWNRLKYSTDKKNYLRALIFYILLDMITLNLFFLPYKII